MANTHASLTALFADIADAIREKTGDTGTIVADQFPDIIRDELQVAPRNHCLTFSSPNLFSIETNNTSKNWGGVLEYSTDKFNWAEWDGSAISAAAVADGYELYICGTGNTKLCEDNLTRWVITGSDVACTGNIETLLDYKTVKAGKNPTMETSCYAYMFSNCTSLTQAPALPATTLADNCYSSMFSGCTRLTTAPDLPATTLGNSCYTGMFQDCTSLTKAPTLPATTLKDRCYNRMFSGCTSLKQVPALPATTLTIVCYGYMFYGCTGIKLSETNTESYTEAYRVPTSGTGTVGTNSLINMFGGTGGTFTGAPSINTTYYLSDANTVV